MENKTYDYIVIGAGYAGLSIAALLAKEGFESLILESHTAIAGCASFYRRKGILFDVGATTFSGVLEHQPAGRLFELLGISPKLRKIDPGMIIKLGDDELFRYADKNLWIAENERVFNLNGLSDFWHELYHINDLAWEATRYNYSLPPVNLHDLIKLAKPGNLKHLNLLSKLFNPLEKKLRQYGLHTDASFTKFIEEQLLITSQNTPSDTPLLTAAMGLAYPSETWYPYGGMYKPAELIKQRFLEFGGELKFKSKVTAIEKENSHYKITTAKGDKYSTLGVISSIPIWNLQRITSGDISKYISGFTKKFTFAWGAFTLNFAIQTDICLPSLYYQIHINEQIKYVDSGSFFVSFSAADDRDRSPENWRAVTISVHTNSSHWLISDKVEYESRKDFVTNKIIENFNKAFPELANIEKEFLLSGTPATWEFFTNRYNGFVGGIPHSVSKNITGMPPNKTPFNKFYLVGDTAFPGQGTPAVILGALNTFLRIKNSKI